MKSILLYIRCFDEICVMGSTFPIKLSILFAVLLISSCGKKETPALRDERDLMRVAEKSFNAIAKNSIVDTSDMSFRQKLSRTISWSQGYSEKIGDSTLVFAPVKLGNELYIKTGGIEDVALNENTWMRATRSNDGHWQFELLTMLPADTGHLTFTGTMIIEDWFSGHRFFSLIQNGNYITLKQLRTRPGGKSSLSMVVDQNPDTYVCFPYTYQSCVTVYDPTGEFSPVVNCTTHLETICEEIDGGTIPVGGGGGSGSSTSTPPSNAAFKNQIEDKPFALYEDIPCEVILAWLATARRQVAQSLLDKLSEIVRTTTIRPGITTQTIARLQDINDAHSLVVNMDYFPVTVTQLPVVNGQRLTAPQFLQHIRKNINGFINTTYTEFSPYHWYGVNETNLWNSSNPLGAVIALDIYGPDDGSVIVSHASTSRWTFSTIFDPKFGMHPVSGHRDFGYIQNANGSYTFFTRGVDRLADVGGHTLQAMTNFPFSQADALWTSFQNKIADYVNNHQGSSTVASQQIHRPNWSEVKAVLEGRAPLSTLSKDCPGELIE